MTLQTVDANVRRAWIVTDGEGNAREMRVDFTGALATFHIALPVGPLSALSLAEEMHRMAGLILDRLKQA